jgi:hypothetical protein
LASPIFCRCGGEISITEALHRFHRGSSLSLCHQVVCLRWLGGGMRLWIFIGRGLPSNMPLFLGGDAWRMPARCGRGAQGLHCSCIFCSMGDFCKLEGLIFK